MGQDLAHKRPWLLASLLFGLSYPLILQLPLPGIMVIAWKMAGVALLVPFTLRRHHSGEFPIVAAIMAFCSLGDGLIELDLRAGAIAFIAAHLTAIWLYSKHRRVRMTFSQKLLTISLLVIPTFIVYFLPSERAMGIQAVIYSLFLFVMAAMAWSSNFPRYRVGIGTILFVISDLLIFARMGALANWPPVNPLIWYLYYFGMVMIATGIVQTLMKRGPYCEEVSAAS